jgi:hypothetical protein
MTPIQREMGKCPCGGKREVYDLSIFPREGRFELSRDLEEYIGFPREEREKLEQEEGGDIVIITSICKRCKQESIMIKREMWAREEQDPFLLDTGSNATTH